MSEILTSIIELMAIVTCFIAIPIVMFKSYIMKDDSYKVGAIVITLIWIPAFYATRYFMYKNFQITLNDENFCQSYDYGLMLVSCNMHEYPIAYVIGFLIIVATWIVLSRNQISQT